MLMWQPVRNDATSCRSIRKKWNNVRLIQIHRRSCLTFSITLSIALEKKTIGTQLETLKWYLTQYSQKIRSINKMKRGTELNWYSILSNQLLSHSSFTAYSFCSSVDQIEKIAGQLQQSDVPLPIFHIL
jgi:hypothetical protein